MPAIKSSPKICKRCKYAKRFWENGEIYSKFHLRQSSLVGEPSHLEEHIQQDCKEPMLQYGLILSEDWPILQDGQKRHSLQVWMAALMLVRHGKSHDIEHFKMTNQ